MDMKCPRCDRVITPDEMVTLAAQKVAWTIPGDDGQDVVTPARATDVRRLFHYSCSPDPAAWEVIGSVRAGDI
jgi:hypothetical protein